MYVYIRVRGSMPRLYTVRRALRRRVVPALALTAIILIVYLHGTSTPVSTVTTTTRNNNLTAPLSCLRALREHTKTRVPYARVLVGDGKVRDCITGEVRSAGERGPVRTTPLVGRGIEEDRDASRKAFQQIFKKRFWGTDKSGLAASGYGSTLDFTIELRAALERLVLELKLHLGVERVRLLDVPCGDMRWMSTFLKDRSDITYTGMDIVPELIAIHQKTFSDKSWKFNSRDVIKEGLNEPYDIILCRDMLHHIATRDVIAFLAQISLSGSRFLLASSHRIAALNNDVDLRALSRGRKLNLEAPPVALAPPLCFSRDGPPNEDVEKSMVLWDLPLRQVVGCVEARRMRITGDRCSVSQPDYYACGNWSV